MALPKKIETIQKAFNREASTYQSFIGTYSGIEYFIDPSGNYVIRGNVFTPSGLPCTAPEAVKKKVESWFEDGPKGREIFFGDVEMINLPGKSKTGKRILQRVRKAYYLDTKKPVGASIANVYYNHVACLEARIFYDRETRVFTFTDPWFDVYAAVLPIIVKEAE